MIDSYGSKINTVASNPTAIPRRCSYMRHFSPLRAIKRKYNPLDWFRSAQGIPLS
ncbi:MULTISPECIES: BBE domain-containing protein [unclassified Mesorhizobium]|uniref:BBE domain-containing protein n=1 Tax=unclassified Mesorhizobium TaxID=325217 RepID=UPI0012E33E24|nr:MULTISPECIES: BBE domain-containing protein [unclassified Mesorhizobium]